MSGNGSFSLEKISNLIYNKTIAPGIESENSPKALITTSGRNFSHQRIGRQINTKID